MGAATLCGAGVLGCTTAGVAVTAAIIISEASIDVLFILCPFQNSVRNLWPQTPWQNCQMFGASWMQEYVEAETCARDQGANGHAGGLTTGSGSFWCIKVEIV
jgi:hypothetical protein